MNEAEFWDKKSGGPVNYYKGLINNPDEKLYRLHVYALSLLGDAAGKRVLDMGCGTGGNSCWLAKRGAKVTAIDISPVNIEKTKSWATKNGVTIDARVMDCGKLGFADASFDMVFGSFILHHIDIEKAAPEIRRVLKGGGKAVFIENSGDNPLLMFFRSRVLPVFGLRKSSPSEYPLTKERIRKAEEHLGKARVHFPETVFFVLFASYFLGDAHWARVLFSSMDGLLSLFAPARRLSYYRILEFTVK
ncbi:MAG: class I SAM-dependent methyltransferase [Candidatus Omnitrophica bacterium]|nr:class I SAM-dependent methyltransferase [Candidatus Omnitrophota bacterium]MDD5311211.1 class I SAM-dependent methyltransferase [Candidatus Omnitrophota bacterium]MDD5546122.1 class I SAM-dependent methyltransferase [Candidatus Omnitrophota bacterium]